ncbi:MAG: NfeD family protein [Clostridiales bacterium]|nr:NfeD family protein [Clostridiales bacterium]
MDTSTTLWLIIAAILVCVEIFSQMVWTICLAVGCIGALIASLCGADTMWQIVTMAATSVVAFLILMPWLKRWHDRQAHRDHHKALTGMDALAGRTGTVTNDITPGATGRVRIDGDNWQAVAPGAETVIETGSEVTVTGYDGNIIFVSAK